MVLRLVHRPAAVAVPDGFNPEGYDWTAIEGALCASCEQSWPCAGFQVEIPGPYHTITLVPCGCLFIIAGTPPTGLLYTCSPTCRNRTTILQVVRQLGVTIDRT